MKPKVILTIWGISLVVGFLIGTIITSTIEVGVVTTLIAFLFSSPYILFSYLFQKSLQKFWAFQVYHLAITIITSFLIYLFAGAFVESLFWLSFVYYGLSFSLQVIYEYQIKDKA